MIELRYVVHGHRSEMDAPRTLQYRQTHAPLGVLGDKLLADPRFWTEWKDVPEIMAADVPK